MRNYWYRRFKKELVSKDIIRFLPMTESVYVYVYGALATVLFHGEWYANAGKLRAVWNTLEAVYEKRFRETNDRKLKAYNSLARALLVLQSDSFAAGVAVSGKKCLPEEVERRRFIMEQSAENAAAAARALRDAED